MSAMEAEGTGLDLKPGFYVTKIRQAANTMLMKITDQVMPKVHGQNLQTRRRLPKISAAEKNFYNHRIIES